MINGIAFPPPASGGGASPNDPAQDAAISALQAADAALGDRVTTLESAPPPADYGTDISALQAADTALSDRVTTLESAPAPVGYDDTALSGRMAVLESIPLATGPGAGTTLASLATGGIDLSALDVTDLSATQQKIVVRAPEQRVIPGHLKGGVTGLTRDHVIAASDAADGISVYAASNGDWITPDPANPGSTLSVSASGATGGTLGAFIDAFNANIVSSGFRDVFASMYLDGDGSLCISVKDPRATGINPMVAPPTEFCSEIGLFVGTDAFRKAEALESVSDTVSSHGERLLAVESFYGRIVGNVDGVSLDAPIQDGAWTGENLTFTFTAAGVSHDVPILLSGAGTTPRQYMDQLTSALAYLYPGLFGDWSADARGRLVLPVLTTSVTAANFADTVEGVYYGSFIGLTNAFFTPASALGDILSGQRKADAKAAAALLGPAVLKTPGFGPYTPSTDLVAYLGVNVGDELHAAFTFQGESATRTGTYTYTVADAGLTFDAFLSAVAAGLNAAVAADDAAMGYASPGIPAPFSASTEGGPAGLNPPLKLVFSTSGRVTDLSFSGRAAWMLAALDTQVLAPANVYDRLAVLEARIAALGG